MILLKNTRPAHKAQEALFLKFSGRLRKDRFRKRVADAMSNGYWEIVINVDGVSSYRTDEYFSEVKSLIESQEFQSFEIKNLLEWRENLLESK